MQENKRCNRCGATNPLDSRFCERCGAPIDGMAEQPSAQSTAPLTSSQPPSKRWNRRYVIYAVVGVLVLATVAASILYFSAPQPSSTDYTSKITSYFQGGGSSVVKPFEKTTAFGADAYVGVVGSNLTLYNETVIPRSSDTDAQSFQKTVVYQLESQGFVELHTVAGVWYGVPSNVSNFTEVAVAALSNGGSPTGSPAVLVTQTPPVAAPATSSAQVSAASVSAQARPS